MIIHRICKFAMAYVRVVWDRLLLFTINGALNIVIAAKRIPGRFLSNTTDPDSGYARMYLHLSYEAFCDRTGRMAQFEWEMHMRWINENLIRPPKATPYYTQQQLIDQNMVGLYQPLYRTLSRWSQIRYWLSIDKFEARLQRVVKHSSRIAEKRFA